MLGRITTSVLKGSFLALCGFALGVSGRSAFATTAPILDIYGPTLTVDAEAQNPHNPMFARFQQRGVDIDGTLRWPMPLGWAVAGDPLGGGYSSGRMIGDVNLCTGSYNPTDVDIALPTLGLPIVIGRNYSCVQENGSGGYLAYDGYQGFNWFQIAQPQITLVQGNTNDLDVMYLTYGNDRFIEFQRIALNATQFKAKNGAAGVLDYDSTNNLYTYYDQKGDQIVFFGFSAGNGSGQLWKMTDPAGNVAYVDNSSSASTANSNGYDISSRMKTFYDASGRKYLFTYSSYGGTFRIEKVEAQIVISSVYTTIAEVDYDYYTSTTSGQGVAGDLRLVTTTMKGVSGGDYVRAKYYRYYTGTTWSNSSGDRGTKHQLKMVVGYDGIRQADVALSISSHNYSAVSDASLMPYSESYFEYISGTDWRLLTAIFNGNCGCAGGTSGTYTFRYDTASTFAADTTDTTYQNGWEQRTVVEQPDGTWVTQYFDETGGVLGRVLTNSDPSGSPTKMWETDVIRNSSGQVTAIHSPENCVNGSYSYSAGTFSHSSSNGLVTTYARHSASSNIDGLRDSVSVQEGTSGSASMVSSVSMSDRQLTVGSTGVSIPQVDTTSTYPSGSNLDTGYTYTYWSSTASNVQYLAPKTITIANPTVTTGHNGSNSATTKVRYVRADGTTAFTQDENSILFYTGRSAYGQMATQIADADTSATSDYVAEDMSGGSNLWSATTSGSAIHAKTTMTYDNQCRILTKTAPAYGSSGSTTRTTTWLYLLDGSELGSFVSPLLSGGNYYGPLSYSRVNHVGKQDRRATIEIGTPAGTIPTSTTPNTTTGTSWSAMADIIYDQSGMRVTDKYTYTSTGAYDDASIGYDEMGRISRTIDATGTISRIVFDERGKVIERWLGTNDNGWTNPTGSAGSPNMVKIEVDEYDGASDGKNGNLSGTSKDSTGAWSGGMGDRITTYQYDFRNRLVVTLPPLAPFSVNKYDNSNRITAIAKYSSPSGLGTSTDPTTTSASTRVALSETAYDERGQVYESTRWDITQTGGSAGAKNASQVTDNWYDADGRLAKSIGQQITKTSYDRLGRAMDQFVIAKVDDTTYSHALDTSGDLVLEQSHSALDPTTGKAVATWLVQRAHDDTSAGSTDALDTNADSLPLKLTAVNLQSHARPQITAMWYDNLERVSESVVYGTNGGSDFDRSGLSVPTRGTEGIPPAFMRTSYAYDTFGRPEDTVDPVGITNRTLYDFAGRKSATIGNFVNGDPHTTAGSNNDQDQRTDYAYTTGLVTAITREMPMTGMTNNDQETDYAYSTVSGSSVIKRKNLLTTVTNPDATTTGYVYNALSEVTSTTDPAGNVITTAYDVRGRVTSRTASTIISGFDTRIKEIDTAYEARGMVNDVVQKDATPTTLDEIAFTYDGWGNLASSTQSPDSAIGGGGRASYAMTLTYSINSGTGLNRTIYWNTLWVPDGAGGTAQANDFNAGIDTYLRRSSFTTDKVSTDLAEYRYLGAGTGTAVAMFYDQPKSGTGTWLYAGSGSSDYPTYMDRFNRPTVVKWSPGIGVNPGFINLDLTYDVQGNVIQLTDNVLMDASSPPKRTFDAITSFDSLRRIIERDEGEASSGSISTRTRIENVPRNLAGRIIEDQVSIDGDTTFDNSALTEPDAGDMQDTRTYNKRNQLTGRSYYDSLHLISGMTPITRTLTYDANGNLTSDGEMYDYVYNPWGQLVQIKLKGTSTVAANYTYNGLGQRISEQLDTNNTGTVGIYSALSGVADGQVNSDDPVFYIAVDQYGRRVATFRNTDTYPKETFFYHPDGVAGPSFRGGLQLRDRDGALSDPTKWATTAASSTRGERFYYCTDHQGNVACLVDSSGNIEEQYRYSHSGVPYGIPKGNVDSSGIVTGTLGGSDYTIVDYDRTHSVYEARADLNLDGLVDSSDVSIVSSASGKSLGRGVFTVGAIGNHDGEHGGELFGEGLTCLEWLTGGVVDTGLALSMTADSSSQSLGASLTGRVLQPNGGLVSLGGGSGDNIATRRAANPYPCEGAPCFWGSMTCTAGTCAGDPVSIGIAMANPLCAGWIPSSWPAAFKNDACKTLAPAPVSPLPTSCSGAECSCPTPPPAAITVLPPVTGPLLGGAYCGTWTRGPCSVPYCCSAVSVTWAFGDSNCTVIPGTAPNPSKGLPYSTLGF